MQRDPNGATGTQEDQVSRLVEHVLTLCHMRLENVSVDRSHDDTVVWITMPGGVLTAPVASELSAATSQLIEDRSVLAVVLQATGTDFCLSTSEDFEPSQFRPDPATSLSQLRPIVVCTIDGNCNDEGFELALAADIRVASPTASFSLGHVTRGTIPCWGGTQRLPRVIQPGRAAALTLLGTTLSAAEALSLGLVYEVSDNPTDAASRLVETLLQRGPLALELAKEAVHRGGELPLREGLRLEGDLNHILASTADRKEGLAAFFEKRPPDFGGR